MLKISKPKNWYFWTCWRRLFGVSWTARGSSQSILKEINLEFSLERLMLKLKLQYFDHLMWSTDSLEKTLMLGKIEAQRRKGWQRMRWTWVWASSGRWWRTGSMVWCSPWHHKDLNMTEQLNNNKCSFTILYIPGPLRILLNPHSAWALYMKQQMYWDLLLRKRFILKYYCSSTTSPKNSSGDVQGDYCCFCAC